jgi:hypothetical protein
MKPKKQNEFTEYTVLFGHKGVISDAYRDIGNYLAGCYPNFRGRAVKRLNSLGIGFKRESNNGSDNSSTTKNSDEDSPNGD